MAQALPATMPLGPLPAVASSFADVLPAAHIRRSRSTEDAAAVEIIDHDVIIRGSESEQY